MAKVIGDNTYVSMKTFLAVIGILVSLMSISTGWMFVRVERAEAKVDALQQTNLGISVSLAEIKTDILWIRKSLDEHMKEDNRIK
jgi:hypothetical protein